MNKIQIWDTLEACLLLSTDSSVVELIDSGFPKQIVKIASKINYYLKNLKIENENLAN